MIGGSKGATVTRVVLALLLLTGLVAGTDLALRVGFLPRRSSNALWTEHRALPVSDVGTRGVPSRARCSTGAAGSLPAVRGWCLRRARSTGVVRGPPVSRSLPSTPRSWRVLARTPAGHGSERHAREPAAQSPRAVAPLLLGLPFRFHLAAAGGRIPIAAVPLARLLITLHCRGLGLGLVLAAAFRIPPTVPDAVLAGPLLRGVLGLRQHRAGRIRRREHRRRRAHGHKQRCCHHRCATHAKHCLPPLCCDSTPRRSIPGELDNP